MLSHQPTLSPASLSSTAITPKHSIASLASSHCWIRRPIRGIPADGRECRASIDRKAAIGVNGEATMSERTEFTVETGTSGSGQPADADPRGMRLVARMLAASVRQRLVAAIRSGRLREIDRIDLLAEEGLPQLARHGAWLLVAATAGFVGLDVAASIE